ncbi:MAG: aminotransferase class I/II-fold pyridoxal phosphate-dependent enzyme [Candidatus Heimdallarchaeota archaeon]|nr:aminotransferase class I/II-fold pyridoxal phosphate-dependent enzyme [Candidatus Heimdallarchaeota archaeon]
MILDKYLSDTGRYVSENVNLAAGSPAWGLRAKKRAKEHSDFINATIGAATEDNGDLMSFPTLVEEIKKLTATQLFAYANMRGISDFVHAWKRDTLDTYPTNLKDKADRLSTLPVTSCGGLTGGLMLASQLFFNQNDPLLAPNTRWGNVDNVFFKNQRLREETYQLVDKEGNLAFCNLIENLKSLQTSEDKIGIYLNFPNNPSGISPTQEQVKEFQDALIEVNKPTVVIVDDAYEGYVYEEKALNHSIFPHLVGLNENVLPIKVDGPSKRFCAYGARLGMVTLGFGEETEDSKKSEVREMIAKIARTNTASSPRGIQEALTNVLTDPVKKQKIAQEKQSNLELMKKRYNLVKEYVESNENNVLHPVNFNSGFFSYFLLKTQQTATEISSKLLEQGLGTVPFVNQNNGLNGIRVAFCSINTEKITKALDILYSIK